MDKEKKKAYDIEYRKRNREKILQQRREYYYANREKAASYGKVYRALNKDKRKLYNKEYNKRKKAEQKEYNKTLNRYQLLTNDEFIQLIAKEDYDLVIHCTIPLINSIADNFTRKVIAELERSQQDQDAIFKDFVSEGMVGVWNAALKYNPNRDTDKPATFITYAKVAITNIMITRYRQIMGGNYEYSCKRVHPTDTFDFNEKDEYGDSKKQFEYVEDTPPINTNQLNEIIDMVIPKQRDKDIIKMCYGIDYDKSMTLKEVAAEMGISHERVRQVRDRLLLVLQENNEYFKELLD